MSINETAQDNRRIAAVTQVPNLPGYGWLTASALRHLIFASKGRVASGGEVLPGNGLEEHGAIIRIGRRVLIDLDCFDDWVDAHRAGSNDAGRIT